MLVKDSIENIELSATCQNVQGKAISNTIHTLFTISLYAIILC